GQQESRVKEAGTARVVRLRGAVAFDHQQGPSLRAKGYRLAIGGKLLQADDRAVEVGKLRGVLRLQADAPDADRRGRCKWKIAHLMLQWSRDARRDRSHHANSANHCPPRQVQFISSRRAAWPC